MSDNPMEQVEISATDWNQNVLSGDTLGEISFNEVRPEDSFLSIMDGNGEPMVKIMANGTIEYGPNYNPDETAQIFWAAMGAHKPTIYCSKCGEEVK